MISDCPPCECNDSHVMRNTLFGLTDLGTVVVCRVFWGALKRKLKWLWDNVFDDEVRDNVNEDESPTQIIKNVVSMLHVMSM
jgi:hypothetical protein